jgi:hypothetical protein
MLGISVTAPDLTENGKQAVNITGRFGLESCQNGIVASV